MFVSPVATTKLAPDNVALTDFADDVYARAFLGMNQRAGSGFMAVVTAFTIVKSTILL